ISREIYYLYDAMTESSESSTSESDDEPWKATSFKKPGNKKVKSNNKKVKPRRNPTRACRKN
ncbi:2573_t:CDS:1, partial [Funneliformis mosseae]